MLNVMTILNDALIILLIMFIFRVIRMTYMNKDKVTSIVLLIINISLFIYFMLYNFMNSFIIFVLFFSYFIIIYIYGKKNYYNIQTKELKFKSNKINSDIKFLFLADFQFDKTVNDRNDKAFDNLIKEINTVLEKYSINTILLGGDYVNYKENIDWFFEKLKKITVKNDVYAVLGNHDFIDLDKMMDKFKELNIKVLENDFVNILINNQEIVLSGVEDMRMGNPDYYMYKENIAENKYHVMLSHNPDYINKIETEEIDLILSGHYHNGQINMIPNLSAAKVITKYPYGLYKLIKSNLYVTSGLGGSVMRGRLATYLRWNADAEIVIISVDSDIIEK